MTPIDRDALIVECMQCASPTVGAFLRQHPAYAHLREDMIGQAAIRVVQTVDKFLAGRVGNLKACCRQAIRFGIWDAIRLENDIQSPRNCDARRDNSYNTMDVNARHNRIEVEIFAEVLDACVTDEERHTLILIKTGMPLPKVAKVLGLSKSTVRSVKRTVWGRMRRIDCG